MISCQRVCLKKYMKGEGRFAGWSFMHRLFLIFALPLVYVLGLTSGICFAEPGWKMYKPSGIVSEEVWVPQQSGTKSAERALKAQTEAQPARMMALAGVAASEAEITPEIEELAGGLQYDATLIYRYVYNHIEFVPVYGANNGATGTLLSGKGSDWDQTSLLIALLRASGYTADYMFGPVVYTLQHVAERLGVPADQNLVGNILASGGWKDLVVYTNDYVQLHRVWAIVTIGGFGMMFDPAFKEHEIVDPFVDDESKDYVQAMGYDRASFLATASQGATIGENYVQGVNWDSTDGIEKELQDYSMNLVNWIKDKAPNATIEDIIGGRRIVPKDVNYSTSLPDAEQIVSYQIDYDIPEAEILTLTVDYCGINYEFKGYEIAGKRVTLFHTGSGNAPELRVDGILVEPGGAGNPTNPGDPGNLHMEVNHPFTAYYGFPADYGFQEADFPLTSPHSYNIAFDFGGSTSRDLIKARLDILEENKLGNPELSEPVLGESLNIMALNWIHEVDLAQSIIASLGNIYSFFNHHVGIMAQEDGYYIDVKMSLNSSTSIEGSSEAIDGHFFGITGVGSAIEHGILEQLQDGDECPGASTVKLLTLNNENGDKTYYGDKDTYFEPGGLREILLNSTYTEEDLSSPDDMVNRGWDVVLPENPNVRVKDWEGLGFIAILDEPGVRGHGYIIEGDFWGGIGTIMTDLEMEILLGIVQVNNPPFDKKLENRIVPARDPVDIASGAFMHDNVDLSLGMGGTMGLQFSRSYRSSRNNENRTMGHGWSHSYEIYVEEHSHGEAGLGTRLPVDAASTIAGGFAAFDLMSNDVNDLLSIMTCTIAQNWIVDQLINNAVTVHSGDRSAEFIRLADGSFSPPPGITDTLIQDGTYRLEKRFGTVFNFASNNSIDNIQDADGNSLQFGYIAEDKLETVEDTFGRILTFGYTGDLVTSVVTYPDGRSVSYGHDGSDNLTSYTDVEGKVWTYDYDPVPYEYYSGHDAYDPDPDMHLMASMTSPRDGIKTVDNTYDHLRRVNTQTVPRRIDGNDVETTYNLYFTGFRNIEEDGEGNQTIYYFDDIGRLVADENALGHKNTYEYDGQNHGTKVTDPRSNDTIFEFDGDHNLTKIINALTYEMNNNYDSQFRLTDVTDHLGHTAHFDYDAKHHPIGTTTYPEPGKEIHTSATYDHPKGLKDTATDGRGTVATMTYDTYGNPDTTTVGDHPSIDYTYDSIGRLRFLTDQEGSTTEFRYDDRGLVTEVIDPLVRTTSFTYYDDGALHTKTDRKNDTITYTYTKSGKVDTATYQDASTVSFVYDVRDNLREMNDALGTTSYDYDEANRLTSATNPHGSAVSYQYDAAGNIIWITYPDSKTVSYTYDELNRLETVTIDWLTNQTATYHYDAAGRLESVDNFNGTWTTYFYDDADRLTELQNAGSGGAIATYVFTLDENGNRTVIEKVEPFSLIPDDINIDYTYNTERNRLLSAGSSTFAYDEEGQIDTGYGNDYTFDYEHRLTGISGTPSTSYSYDGAGNRLQAVRDGVTTRYIYVAAGNLLAEADQNNVITRYYIYGLGLLAMVTPSGDVYCYHFDAIGNTIAITDDAENAVNKYAYTSFGKIMDETEAIAQPFKFVGQHGVMTEPNGFYYMRARYYDPQVGRFVSEDPAGFGGGDINLYVYVQNNPILQIDPNGQYAQFVYAAQWLSIQAQSLYYRAAPYVARGASYVGQQVERGAVAASSTYLQYAPVINRWATRFVQDVWGTGQPGVKTTVEKVWESAKSALENNTRGGSQDRPERSRGSSGSSVKPSKRF